MMGLCLLPIAAFVAVGVFNVSVSNLLFFGLLLACPLMHVFMMRGMGHQHGGSAQGASCHEQPAPGVAPGSVPVPQETLRPASGRPQQPLVASSQE